MALLLDEFKNVIQNPQKVLTFGKFEQKDFYNEILDFYKMLPWFKEKVNDIYINPKNENTKKLIIKNDFIKDSEGLLYYRPNKKYFEVQLNAKYRKQIGYIHTLQIDDVEYKMKIGIITKYGLFQQNEDIFQAQIQFLKHWKEKSRDSEIEIILKSSVTKTEPICFYIFTFFTSIGFKDSKYIQNVLQIYQKHFGQEGKIFMENILDLLIFLKPKLSLIHSTNFLERFKKLYYKPEILPFLSEYEKLEEIYNDKFSPPETKMKVSEILYDQKQKMLTEWINSLLIQESIGLKQIHDKIKTEKLKYVDLPSWKQVCKNYHDLIDIDDIDIVYVQDGRDIYGFTISTMFELIEEKDCHNPYTKNVFSREFVSRFLDTYYKPVKLNKNFTGDVESDEINQLEKLLNDQLSLLEKICFQCKNKKYKSTIYIETNDMILNFCSSECMVQFNLEEFRNIEV